MQRLFPTDTGPRAYLLLSCARVDADAQTQKASGSRWFNPRQSPQTDKTRSPPHKIRWPDNSPLRRGLLTILLILVGGHGQLATAAPDGKSPDPVVEARAKALGNAIVGSWSAPVGREAIKLRFDSDGRFELGTTTGSYRIEPSVLTLVTDDNVETRYQHKLPVVNNISGDQLELSGGELAVTLLFNREREVADYTSGLLDLSPQQLTTSGGRILTVMVIVGLAWALIRSLQWLSRLVIFSNLGPLRSLYLEHKHRSETVHSLVLNLTKYVVYFSALGLILTELGVNYTAYLASLSVIGLAIGFGSQGLVQDMVTGFFVIFESQYDVGDMVEISGQTGVVEELGLRMTRLRNYQGQQVVIPNRNIATVGRYTNGAQHVTLDIATAVESVDSAVEVLQQVALEIAAEFAGVVRGAPVTRRGLEPEADENYIRLTLSIWPLQTWLVDQQLVPRIRERFTGQQLPITGDRVTVFYQLPESRRVQHA